MERTIQSMVITAIAPWKSIYREDVVQEQHTTDTQEEIDFCLHHCPYANTECCDCLSGGKPDARQKIDLDRLKEMLTLKRPNAEICKELGVDRATVYRNKKKLGM